MPAGIGNGVCRYSVAVDNVLIIRSSGQRSLGDRHSYGSSRNRIEVVEVTLYAVVNTIRTGIFCLRQRRLPAIRESRIETVLEGAVVGLAGCDEGLVRCGINEVFNSRRRGIGYRHFGDSSHRRFRSDIIRMSFAHEFIIDRVYARDSSLRQICAPALRLFRIETVLNMTFLSYTGFNQFLCQAVVCERVEALRIGGDDRCINSLNTQTFFKEVACFDIPANELVTVEVRSRIRDMEQRYFLVLEFAVLTDIRYVVLNQRYEIRPSLLGVGEFCYYFVIYQCFGSIDQCVVFLASRLDSSFDSRVINNLSRDCLDCCDSIQCCVLCRSVCHFLYISVIQRTLGCVAQLLVCHESCCDSRTAGRILNRSRDSINQVFDSLSRIQRSSRRYTRVETGHSSLSCGQHIIVGYHWFLVSVQSLVRSACVINRIARSELQLYRRRDIVDLGNYCICLGFD